MNQETEFLGELAPLHVEKHVGRPERRQISQRWLISTVLVGTTSFLMMGGALFAALDGQEQLAVPAVAYQKDDDASSLVLASKGNHPGLIKKFTPEENSNIMMVSTISRVGNNNVVKVRPFKNIKAPMALAPQSSIDFPNFNPLTVFSESGKLELISDTSDFMYGADVEGEVTLNVFDFPVDTEIAKIPQGRRAAEVHAQVKAVSNRLDNGSSYVSSLAFFDADRFSGEDGLFIATEDVTITAENVSYHERQRAAHGIGTHYIERTIEVRSDASIAEILKSEGIGEAEVSELATVLESDIGEDKLRSGDTIQAWLRQENISADLHTISLAKASLYRGPSHMVSIARTDDNRLVYAPKPETPQSILEDAKEQPAISTKSLPTVYTGIYRAALAEGMTVELAGSLIKIFAFDVDFRSRIKPTDRLEVFLSLEEGEEKPNESSEILYAGIELGGVMRRYYRFRDEETGRIDYYDEKGKSAKKFLLRQPVPNGRFTSGFGMRRHPISRVYKLHGGVDWAAPRGTPILAAGNGMITKAGWSSSGYGKQTVIRHANGYETSYSHQTAIAKGMTAGKRVRQGQIIGYVGSTGYSTGPHLHYEVKVNSNRVDPMRIRLPEGKILKDTELAAFEAERDRINALVYGDDQEPTELASN